MGNTETNQNRTQLSQIESSFGIPLSKILELAINGNIVLWTYLENVIGLRTLEHINSWVKVPASAIAAALSRGVPYITLEGVVEREDGKTNHVGMMTRIELRSTPFSNLFVYANEITLLLNPSPKQSQSFIHGPDYRSIRLRAQELSLTPNEAAIIRILHENHSQGTPDVSGDFLLTQIETNTKRLRDVFARREIYQLLVAEGKTKGTVCLNI